MIKNQMIHLQVIQLNSKILSLQTGLKVLEATIEREMKESGEKGGTEDINIGIGEMQSSIPKMQETLQILSDKSKSLHKTQMAAIRATG